jgi:hypothetical protein
LLWAIVDRGKAFSSLHTIDMSDYRRFLQDPMPVDQWIGPPKKKGHTEWKPFTGPLSTQSTRYAETVFECLVFLVSRSALFADQSHERHATVIQD